MPESHPNALPTGHRIDEYEIVRVLGAGGFGITYLAYDHTLDGPVALKEYFPSVLAARTDDQRVVPSSISHGDEFRWGLERFLQEARTLHRLRHPNIVRVLHFVEAHGTGYIVMEYVEGEPLAAVLQRCGRMTPAQWRPLLDQLLDGLAHVHDRGHLHRDIKPANIVLQAADGAAVLIDFGAARAAASDRTHTRILTPAYAPIEQHATGATVGSPADLYALAAVSYQALTGSPPPAAPDRMLEDKYKPLTEEIDGADWNWLAAIDWALAQRPDDRPPTATVWRESTDVAGQFRLGRMYMLGRGVPPDQAQATFWYRKAAEQGHAEAQLVVGLGYAHGVGMTADASAAAVWFRRAAEQGVTHAQFTLGRLLELGRGVPEDETQALAWFREAAEQGDENAQCHLGFHYRFLEDDYAAALSWFGNAAEQGHAEAQYFLGEMYEQGIGVRVDYAQALEYYRKSAEQEATNPFAKWCRGKAQDGVTRLAKLCKQKQNATKD